MKKQLALLSLLLAAFLLFNGSMYALLTCRLGNNFSDVSQSKMVDVRLYLPFEENSSLPKVHSSLHLEKELPILDGAAALLPVYAAIVENVYPKGCVTFTGGTFSDEGSTGENFAPDSAMQYKNTVRGYQAIVEGTTDILFCAAPSEEQRAYAQEKGVELVYVPIGLEGFVFFVNEKNPVEDLTPEQIRKIYSGAITNWAQVGGANRTINPITRLEGSGSQTAFLSFMGEERIGRKSLLALTGASIGFSFRYYMEGIVGNEKVKMLSLNGVAPTEENIQNGTYPIVAPFYAIYRKDHANENIPILLDWLLSEEGQNLIEKSGYVRVH